MIYGPGDSRTLKLFKPISEGRFFYVGAGEASVHFIDVRDLAQSFLLAAENQNINGEIFIIAGETPLPLKNLAVTIAHLMGVREPWLHLPVKPMQALGSLCEAICKPFRINPPIFRRRVDFFTKSRSFDTSKASEMLRFKPSKSLIQELIEIIDSYVRLGMIEEARIKRPSVMLRGMDGHIRVWDEGDRPIYGWSTEQAIGSVSHSLLKTEFPKDLNIINRILKESGSWSGPLLHRSRDGHTVEVQSKWKLLNLPSNNDDLILEINNPVKKDTSNTSVGSFISSLIGSAAALAPDALEVAFRMPACSL